MIVLRNKPLLILMVRMVKVMGLMQIEPVESFFVCLVLVLSVCVLAPACACSMDIL